MDEDEGQAFFAGIVHCLACTAADGAVDVIDGYQHIGSVYHVVVARLVPLRSGDGAYGHALGNSMSRYFGRSFRLNRISPFHISTPTYKDIGGRIRAVRTDKGITQERLAELVGVGTTHISHIETGNTVPSLKVLIGIINALDCSSDELLCIEIEKAKPVFDAWLSEEFADCSDTERRILSDTLRALKSTLRKNSGGTKA